MENANRMFGNNISSKGAIELFKALKQSNSTVTNISLSENALSDGIMISLGEFIQSSKYIEEILIGDYYGRSLISDHGINILAYYLFGNSTLRTLDISYAKSVTNRSIAILVAIIENTCLELINVWGTSIVDSSLLAVAQFKNILKNKSNSIRLSEM